jgi:hypothetical protein
MNILSPKIGIFQIGPKNETGDFFENGSNDVDHISGIYEDHSLKYNDHSGRAV